MDISIAGVKTLELKVTDAGDGINSDHADWAAAQLLR
ncbi:NPCBM/NEW2 domain-containing protein [Nonomuraea muscovyensis]